MARCAREEDDSGEVRLAKIERIIAECEFGIHDISEVDLDPVNNLPRFNMPLELGLFFGCRRFGGPQQKTKISLVLDTEPYRYQKIISDIAGHDIRPHGREPNRAIRAVRDWLATASSKSHRKLLRGAAAIIKRYHRFRDDLPGLCEVTGIEPDALTFNELSTMIIDWLKSNR